MEVTPKVKVYFKKLFAPENFGQKFPIDLDEVWEWAYDKKSNALRALENGEYLEGEDYFVGDKPQNEYDLSNNSLHLSNNNLLTNEEINPDKVQGNIGKVQAKMFQEKKERGAKSEKVWLSKETFQLLIARAKGNRDIFREYIRAMDFVHGLYTRLAKVIKDIVECNSLLKKLRHENKLTDKGKAMQEAHHLLESLYAEEKSIKKLLHEYEIKGCLFPTEKQNIGNQLADVAISIQKASIDYENTKANMNSTEGGRQYLVTIEKLKSLKSEKRRIEKQAFGNEYNKKLKA